jgi:thiamine biosynthesis lipoprotein
VIGAGGVATSSTERRRWKASGNEVHHIVDPTTGRSAETDVAEVTVVASSAWLAEALATAVIVSGVEGSTEMVQRLASAGRIKTTSGENLPFGAWEQSL